MASLVLRGFGGMAPSSRDSGADPGIARYARNLDTRYSDFRPLRQAVVVDTATAGSTLYQFETVSGFITNTDQVNYVRGPIPTDATERTYYTGDGAPKVTDNTGDVRQLGVPAPTDAPAVVVNATTQYSTDDASADQAKKLSEIVTAIRANYTWPFRGLSDADLADDFVARPEALWSYSFEFAGSMVAGAFVPTNPAHANLMDDRLYFHVVDTGGGVYVGRVDLDVRGQQIELGAGLDAALAAITDPTDPAEALLTDDQVDTFHAMLDDALQPADTAFEEGVVRLRELKDQFVSLANSGSSASTASTGAVATFYERTEVVAAIDAAVDAAVAAIFDAMYTYDTA